MAIDKNPRTFYLEVTDIQANVDADSTVDFVVIEFAGRVTPSVKERLTKAFDNGDFNLIDKKLV